MQWQLAVSPIHLLKTFCFEAMHEKNAQTLAEWNRIIQETVYAGYEA